MTMHADDAHVALLEFFGRAPPKYRWTDSAPKLIGAISEMNALRGKAGRFRRQNNGFCERAVGQSVAGASFAVRF